MLDEIIVFAQFLSIVRQFNIIKNLQGNILFKFPTLISKDQIMDGVLFKERYTPLSPMSGFFQGMGIFGGFPLTPISSSKIYAESPISSPYSERNLSGSRKNDEDDHSWKDFYALEVSTTKFAWCYAINTLLWIVILAIFFAISYGNDHSGLEYLFPLNVSSR